MCLNRYDIFQFFPPRVNIILYINNLLNLIIISIGDFGVCTNYHCDYGAHCVQKNGQAHCECPLCGNEFDPICGSDGISYGNLCKLQLEECRHHRNIHLLYKGLCSE